ncbi:RPM1 interacting protein 13-like isoform X2 [Phragmites australis]|uniref:RPM1 interacting protein 13-like isoform X2 n=1 Tax=Phragmites australis TaxID=29695 RepID=UPI002D790A4F|nr:RPM1 interacting protein 13-like isoform X2 [Phragmites australis]
MPAAGKRKSPEDALEWAEKRLGEEDSDADTTNVVVDEKESVVDDKRCGRDAYDEDDDDDDCVILDGDPDKAVAVAKEGPGRDASEDELQIVAEKGELACRDFPHPRHLCVSLPFSTSSHANHCNMCHCYVCDSPAPCTFWGKGFMLNDHCHATDKDAKWKKLRQLSKCKSELMSKRGNIQNFFHSSSTTPSSQPAANVILPPTGRFPVSSMLSQNQQVPPTMFPQNLGQGICMLGLPSPMPRTTIPLNGSKRTQVAPPVYTPSTVNHLQPSVPSYGRMQPAYARAFQTAQVPPGDNSAGTFQSYRSLLRLNAPIGSQGHHYQPPSYPQVAPNTVVGSGVPFSRCTSLATQGTQHPQDPSADTILKNALANLAYELGVPDYNIDQPLG